MKITIEGDEKKMKQLFKELLLRCKRDKVELKINETEKVKESKKPETKSNLFDKPKKTVKK